MVRAAFTPDGWAFQVEEMDMIHLVRRDLMHALQIS